MNPVGPSYAAYAFLSGQEARDPEKGVLFIHGGILYFRSEGMSLNIPLTYLQIEVAGEEQTEFRFTHANATGWTLCTPDETIFEHPDMKRAPTVRAQLQRMFGGRELKRRLKITGGIFAACILLAWLGSVAVGAMVRSVVARVPAKYETEMGVEAMKELRAEFELLDDSNRVARLEALSRPLVQATVPRHATFHFYIMDEDIPNACALPGGHVVVTTGLLDMCETPDELLGIIAHELAHVTRQHAIRTKIASAGPFLIFAVFARQGGGVSELLADSSALLIRQSFSQQYEMEADDAGWNLLVAARVNPHGMIDAFRRLETLEQNLKFRSDTPVAFRSHPPTMKRIARLESKWQKLPVKTGFIDTTGAKL